MAERRPLVVIGGRVREIASGDVLPSAAIPASAINGRGTTESKPAASAANVGWLYYDTTLGKLQRSNGTTWEDCEGDGSSSGVSIGLVLALTE